MKILPKIRKLIGLFTILLFLTACGPGVRVDRQPPQTIEGVIDLRAWDFEKDGSLELEGDWSFWWRELLQPDQVTALGGSTFVHVPDVWSDYEIDGSAIPTQGYATYHLTLYLPAGRQAYGIYNEGQGSAYALWVGGRPLAQNGQVGTSPQTMTPGKKPTTVFFEADGEPVEIVLQVSNFHHRKGGFRNPLLLGRAQQVHRYQLQNWFLDAFSLGVLIMMGLYHFIIYLFRMKNRAPFYFALLCWAVAIRLGVTDQNVLLLQFPGISWSLALRLEYLVFFLVPLPFVLFLRSLYPRDIHRWFVWAVFGSGIAFSLIFVFSSTLILSYSATYYQFVFILEILYYLYVLGRIILKRRAGALYVGFASLIVFAAIVLETLVLQNVIKPLYLQNFLPVGHISSFGFLTYIFIQAILLAARFSQSFLRVEALSLELEATNVSLEHSERKYRAIFEDSKDVIFITGLNSRIEDVNPACEDVLGYTRAEMKQSRVQDVMSKPELLTSYLQIVNAQGSIKNMEVELLHKDGRRVSALVSIAHRKDENGGVTGYQGVVRDISAMKQAEVERLRALKFEQISITDALTQVHNRRYFYDAAKREIERARRNDSSLAIIIFDIDNFKSVNDRYGHLVGDQVLVNLAGLCQQNMRSADLFARFGGEEFVILAPDTEPRAAWEIAERLRDIAAGKPVANAANVDVSVTLSLGVVNWDPSEPLEIDELLDRADQALYRAKASGRNRVVAWRDVHPA